MSTKDYQNRITQLCHRSGFGGRYYVEIYFRGKIFKYCEGFGYLAMCEIMKEFNNITLNDLIGL